ncbi:hypothetical protein KIF53_12225 [Chromobacterium subtsugae]|uniref:GtrA-like protein domain-containing protein n=1 Tax=Chromobacterium subtsugae TaxID=251747 RepID=A0ABS7FE95_9NEIS|nr:MULTISPECIES: hypothetical protein [Chromobacterium]MBW7566711.1 hypothetical protein [Chromobacterium subtsugae]MBW8288394.1 hypothetical protein [Chromobacterium subtsugae]WSE92287.1 hypothetical protein U6115_03290 [Chromobacterium subtsugae]WVH60665.1 hypothetical protein U6151_03310 [Chromobacterium subtsugae]
MRTQYLRLVRLSAIYDLIATAAFATPWTFAVVHALLGKISPLPAFAPIHVLFANLLGSVVVVWSVLRLRRPEAEFGLYDAFARGLFFAWQLYYLLAMDGVAIVWGFAAMEAAFGLAQGYGYWLLRQAESGKPSRCRVARALRAAA